MRNMTKRRRALMPSSTHESRLPPEYQEVAWLRGTGTQYSLTDYYATRLQNGEITVIKGDLTINDFSTSETAIMASWLESSNLFYHGIRVRLAASNAEFYYHYGKPSTNQYVSLYPSNFGTSPMDVHYELNVDNIVFNNTVTQINPQMYYNKSSQPITIGAYRFNTGSLVVHNNNVLIKPFSIYNRDTLLTEVIPCYRKSDNKAGFYQMIVPEGGTNFQPNRASGDDWIIGPVV